MATDDGPQLSELESLQLKANQITDESLESTRRMIQLCEEVGVQSDKGHFLLFVPYSFSDAVICIY